MVEVPSYGSVEGVMFESFAWQCRAYGYGWQSTCIGTPSTGRCHMLTVATILERWNRMPPCFICWIQGVPEIPRMQSSVEVVAKAMV